MHSGGDTSQLNLRRTWLHPPFEGDVWAARSETGKNRRQSMVLGLFRPEIVPGGPPTPRPFSRWLNRSCPRRDGPSGAKTHSTNAQTGVACAGEGDMTVQIAIQSDARQAAVFQQVACLVRGALRPDAGWLPLHREQAAKAHSAPALLAVQKWSTGNLYAVPSVRLADVWPPLRPHETISEYDKPRVNARRVTSVQVVRKLQPFFAQGFRKD